MLDYRLPDSKVEIIFRRKFSTKNYMDFIKSLLFNEIEVKEFCSNMIIDLKKNGIDVEKETSEFYFIHEKLNSSLVFSEKYPGSFRFDLLNKNLSN